MSTATYRILELLFGVPLLLFGGYLIYYDISGYLWVMADPEHRRMFFFVTLIGILPFLIGAWLVSASVRRMIRRPKVSQPSRPDSRRPA
jgi:hypothetical protein